VDGEKPNAYYCSLERNFNTQKCISKLNVRKDGTEGKIEINNQTQIENEVRDYYAHLCENHDSYLTKDIPEFLGLNPENPSLSEDLSLDLK